MKYLDELIAKEVSSLTRYCDRVVQWRVLPNDSGAVLDAIDCAHKERLAPGAALPAFAEEERSAVLLHATVNHDLDIEQSLREVAQAMNRSSRLIIVLFNPYARAVYAVANKLGMREGPMPSTFVTEVHLEHMARLAGLEIVRHRQVGYMPLRAGPPGTALNRGMGLVPGLRHLGLVSVIILRPTKPGKKKPSLSVVIPARNERGNIENALVRLRDLNKKVDLEVLFIEGHSSDGTWEEIERVTAAYAKEFKLQAHRQTGKGKNDAVRLGFSKAKHDLLTILDADLTMPPEKLHRFYDAYCKGLGDFINGDRLVYPMENEAMRFLNLLGNVFFAKALSTVLQAELGDSLCGTKLLARRDYERVVAWRKDFGDFDPFGYFELLFPAAVLGLGIVDLPVAYKARVYGETQIHRFRHGAQLLRMTAIGLSRLLPSVG